MVDRPPDNPDREHKGEAIIYAFPTRSRCPKCHSPRTVTNSSHGPKQFRHCLMCGENYQAIGWRI